MSIMEGAHHYGRSFAHQAAERARREQHAVVRRQDRADLAGSTAVGALVAFVLLALSVKGRGGAPLFGDQDLLAWSVGHRPPVGVSVARAVTYTGTGLVPYLLAAVAGLLIGRTLRQRVVAVAACLACLAMGQTVRYSVMSLAARPRPAAENWVTHPSGWSFPSGHTTTSAMAAGLLALAILVRAPRGRAGFVAAALTWGALVGLSRVYLGVHWFSDVLGGWLLALCWLSLCTYAAIRLVRRTGTATPESTESPAP
ncbi:phosphatase PAP2 family protein [Streptomyces sp. NPDC001156]